MGRIYKRNKSWYIDLYVKGRRIRRKVGSSKRIAELALSEAEVKAARDEFGFSKQDIAIDKLFNRFLEYSSANHRPSSTNRYRAVIDNFNRFIVDRKLTFVSEIKAETIDGYKVYRKNSIVGENNEQKTKAGAKAYTINFELDTLRLIFNLAIKWDYLKENPTKEIKRLKVDDAKPIRFLTNKECDLLLEYAPSDLYPIYFTFLNSGMRKAELEYLTWEDIDFRRKKLWIRRKNGWNPKSGEREIPINQSLLDLLKDLKKKKTNFQETDYILNLIGTGYSRNKLRNELIKIAIKAKIPNFTKLHTLRHTFASHLVMAGVDLPTLKNLMGHSDIQTTMIYAHLAPDHLKDAVDKLKF